MTIVGFRKTAFTPKGEDTEIRGYNLYLEYEADKVEGYATERIFLTENKLGTYVPQLGEAVDLVYNRYGKVDKLLVL